MAYANALSRTANLAQWYVTSHHLGYISTYPRMKGPGAALHLLASQHRGWLGFVFSLAYNVHRALDLGCHVLSFSNDRRRLDHLVSGIIHAAKYTSLLASPEAARFVKITDSIDCITHATTGAIRFGVRTLVSSMLGILAFEKLLVLATRQRQDRNLARWLVFLAVAVASAMVARVPTYHLRKDTTRDEEDGPPREETDMKESTLQRLSGEMVTKGTPTRLQLVCAKSFISEDSDYEASDYLSPPPTPLTWNQGR